MENTQKIINPSFEHYNQAKMLYRFIINRGIEFSDEEFIKYFEKQTGRNIEKCMPFVKSNAEFPENIAMDVEPLYVSFEKEKYNNTPQNVILGNSLEYLEARNYKALTKHLKTVYYARIIQIEKPSVSIETINRLV